MGGKFRTESCDCLVAGGGTAGVIAAIQAGRAGADVILTEMNPLPGGTMTFGKVSSPAYFFAGGRRIVGGIGWELVKETVELSGGKLPDFRVPVPGHTGHAVYVDPNLYPVLAEEKCLRAGVRLRYQEILTALRPLGNGWEAEVTGNGVFRKIRAREVIDCTGDATAVRLAGGPCVCGEERQPGTLEFQLSGYDCAALDADSLERAFRKALADGELQPGDYCDADRPLIRYLRSRGYNLQHIFHADASDSEKQTGASITGRQRLLAMLRFLRRQPGLENCVIADAAPLTAVREGWRILGERTVTEEDYLQGVLYDDAIAWSSYFIDVHHETGVRRRHLAPGVFPTIPFGALIPRGMKRILAAGRSISSDRGAFSALRVGASCMAMGQAAGAAAALAVRTGIPSRDVPLDSLRKLLRDHGAAVPVPGVVTEPEYPEDPA